MPRDGSNIYHRPPGTDGIPNYTIESAKYNASVADVEQDLNLPRPIVAGGTGANNAHDALINLKGEEALQQVTNYDTFPFVSGSFWSDGTATAPPVAGQPASGICYVYGDPQFATLEARAVAGADTDKYVRQKLSGAWGAWKKQAGSTADLDASYVNVAGDTMTGALTVGAALAASAAITAGSAGTSGTYYFGNTGTKSLAYDGAKFNFAGGNLYVGGTVVAFNPAAATAGTFSFGNTGTKYLNFDGTSFNLVGGNLNISASSVAIWNPSPLTLETNTPAAWPAAIKGNDRGIIYLAGSASNIYAFFCQGSLANNVGQISGSTTATTYSTSSSGELKEDLKSFDAGNIIDDTRVFDFAWKSTGERSYGVIAQQAIEVYPMAVQHVESVSDEIGEYWGVDYSKYVPVLLQELKALRARVRDLEGRIDMKPQPA